MEYYNLKYLVILLCLTVVNIYLINTWTSDKGYLLFIIILFGIISIIFWIVLSTISYLKKGNLKHELFYYLGIGVWHILMTVEYFKLNIIEKNNDIIHWIPHVLIILFSLLPIKQIWINRKVR